MTSSPQSILLAQPNVVIGDYYGCLDFIINKKFEEWIIPKILWIDYRVIPLTIFYHISHKLSSLKSNCYFLEASSTKDYYRIFNSTMLSTLSENGFSSLFVNYPPFCSHNIENWTYLKKLSTSLVVNFLTSNDIFPANECTLSVVV